MPNNKSLLKHVKLSRQHSFYLSKRFGLVRCGRWEVIHSFTFAMVATGHGTCRSHESSNIGSFDSLVLRIGCRHSRFYNKHSFVPPINESLITPSRKHHWHVSLHTKINKTYVSLDQLWQCIFCQSLPTLLQGWRIAPHHTTQLLPAHPHRLCRWDLYFLGMWTLFGIILNELYSYKLILPVKIANLYNKM